jgi:hypothetical protein
MPARFEPLSHCPLDVARCAPEKSGSQRTPLWREMDSNPRPFVPNPAFLRLSEPRLQPICTPNVHQFAPLPQRKSCRIEGTFSPLVAGSHRVPNAPWVRASEIDQCQVDYTQTCGSRCGLVRPFSWRTRSTVCKRAVSAVWYMARP